MTAFVAVGEQCVVVGNRTRRGIYRGGRSSGHSGGDCEGKAGMARWYLRKGVIQAVCRGAVVVV